VKERFRAELGEKNMTVIRRAFEEAKHE